MFVTRKYYEIHVARFDMIARPVLIESGVRCACAGRLVDVQSCNTKVLNQVCLCSYLLVDGPTTLNFVGDCV